VLEAERDLLGLAAGVGDAVGKLADGGGRS
jgi:hypothetical protein